MEAENKKIKVLIVDDSALVRQTLTNIIATDEDLEVIGSAANPFDAVKLMKKQRPDVITLDIEMPRMDGLTFLQKIMQQHPIPVVVISTLTQKGSVLAMDALEFGAVEIITKPKVNTRKLLSESTIGLCQAIKSASMANIKRLNKHVVNHYREVRNQQVLSFHKTTDKIIAIGASTGGTEAIKSILMALPANAPGIVIVQHMPETFTRQFADRLDSLCKITVKEAQNGDTILNGHVLIAPGNKHMIVKRSGARNYVEVKDGPYVNRHRPSVDVLFKSTARYLGKNALGIILTGMGGDGAKGMKEMYDAGAFTIAQDEKSCVVFGMPKEAINLKGVNEIVSLDEIPSAIAARC